MLWQLIIVFVLSCLVIYRHRRRKVYALAKKLKCDFVKLPILGHSYIFVGNGEDRMNAFKRLALQALNKGGLTSFWLVDKLFVVAVDAADIEIITKTSLNKDDIMKGFSNLIGNGTFVAPVPIWRRRRKYLMPSFCPKKMVDYVSTFAKQSKIMADLLEKNYAKRSHISVFDYLCGYTLVSIFETSLGMDLAVQGNQNHPFLTAMQDICELTAAAFCQPWLRIKGVAKLMSTYEKSHRCRKVLRETVEEAIKQKREQLKNGLNENNESPDIFGNVKYKTFLDMLIESSGSERGYSDVELREEALVLTLAGTDTSAAGASFTLLMLARHPDVQQKVYEELQEVFGDSTKLPEADDLTKLKYLDAVIRETLRLYPPGPVIVRKVENDLVLPSGVTLIAGVGVLINIWGLHRNRLYWGDDAAVFRPERFLEPLKHPAAFMAFSYGPRNCPGHHFAMMAIKTSLSAILLRYRVLPSQYENTDGKHEELRVKFDITMKHVDDFKVKLEIR